MCEKTRVHPGSGVGGWGGVSHSSYVLPMHLALCLDDYVQCYRGRNRPQCTVGGVEAGLKTSHWSEPLRDDVTKNSLHGAVDAKDRLIKDGRHGRELKSRPTCTEVTQGREGERDKGGSAGRGGFLGGVLRLLAR